MKTHITRFSMLIAAMAVMLFFWLTPTQAQAATTEDGFTYIIVNESAVTITGYNGTAEELVVPDTIEKLPVTKIADNAFENCTGFYMVTIPDSVQEIGACAFSNCTFLSDVLLGDGVITIGSYAFAHCESLFEITIPDSVTSLGNAAFWDCTSLTRATIGNGVTSLENGTFSDCTSLTKVEIGSAVSTMTSPFGGCTNLLNVYISDLAAWCKIYFGGSDSNPMYYAKKLYLNGTLVTNLEIPACVTSISNYAFYDCECIKTVTIGSRVTNIGQMAFRYCENITSVTVSDRVTSIGNYAFADCVGMKEITLGSNLSAVSEYMLYNCTGLQSITIPESVTAIEAYAFENCAAMTEAIIGENVASIGEYAFHKCFGLEELTIPDSVTNIGSCAFAQCTAMTDVHIGAGLKSISGGAFSSCTSLYSVEIPDNVTTIGGSAFSSCSSLKAVIIGDGVQTVSGYAFEYCTNLTDITIGNGLTTMNSGVFYDCTNLRKVYISDLTTWCKISFAGVSANPMYYATELYLNGELLTDLVIPEKITSVQNYAFYSCECLTSVTIGSKVTNIGDSAFRYCTNINEVTITDRVSDLGTYAFADCTGLKTVNLGSNVAAIGEGTFYNCIKLYNVTLPDGVGTVGKNAFCGCVSISGMVLPSSITSIGDYAFSGCSGMYSVTIPDSVVTIGAGAFRETGLVSVTIPASVTKIGDQAFYMDPYQGSNLKSIIFRGSKPTWSSGTFSYVYGTVYYPANNVTWTSVSLPTYNGNLKWVSYENEDWVSPEADKPSAELAFAGLTLGDDLTMRFYVKIDPAVAQKAYIQINVGIDESVTVKVADAETDSDGNYIFTADVAAAQMTDTITLHLILGNRKTLVDTYSVKEYANSLLQDESLSQCHALVKAMLNYGAQAQIYFDYNIDKLANDGIATDTAVVPQKTDMLLQLSGAVDGIRYYGATLLFDTKTAVRYYFDVSGDISSYSFSVGGNNYKPVEKSGLWYVEVPGVNPQDLDEETVLTISNSTNTITVTYSPMCYVIKLYNGNGSESLKSLLQALYGYYLAAEAYIEV